MSETTFFATANRQNHRKVKLQTATLLVGKAPSKEKRIKIKLQMPLSGEKMTGLPSWLMDAYEFVAKNHDKVVPEVAFSGFDVSFSADHLFGDKRVQSIKCQMRGFTIIEVGDSEQPDVVLPFYIYAPYSTALWRWCGEMGGQEFWAKFTPGLPEDEEEEEEEQPELELSGEDEANDDAAEEEFEGEDEEEETGDDAPGAKSGQEFNRRRRVQ